MQEGGKISRKILDEALSLCKAEVSTLEIDSKVEKMIKDNGSEPWFMEVGDYRYSTCISVNDIWLHGIPSDYRLQENDIVSIDIGIKYKGYYLDNCWTCVVQAQSSEIKNIRRQFDHKDKSVTKFLNVGVAALQLSIDKFRASNYVGDISYTMQKTVERHKFSVIRDFAGHGVGFSYHEEPQIPCAGFKSTGCELKNGMVFAIELMYAMGGYKTLVSDDKWTITTADGSLSAMFEHTVALTEKGPIILTI